MKQANLEVKAGFDKGSDNAPSVNEIEQAGYDVKETDAKLYAISEQELDIPENVDEALSLVGEDKLLEYFLATYRVRECFDPVRKEMKRVLRKEVPADVKATIKSLKQQAEAGLTPYDVSDLDEIPFEYKTSTEKLFSYVKEALM